MKTLALRLEGPLQSWGVQSKHGIREAGGEPSKSGVLGLVGCALGMARDDQPLLEQLASTSFAVRVDRSGSLLRDFHTAGGGTFRGNGKYAVFGNKNPVTSQRFYWQDASFLALLGSTDTSLIDRIADALRDPRWPLFLGRRSCVPTAPVLESELSLPPEAAAADVPRAERSAAGALRAYVECDASEGDPRLDVPASFASAGRRHRRRFVKTVYVDPPTPTTEAT